MGEQEGWADPSGPLPNGLLSGTGLVMRSLETDRWLKAEDRTSELIACIQPNPPSEERRNAVADYVQRLIMKCFPCQVITNKLLVFYLFCKKSCTIIRFISGNNGILAFAEIGN